MSDSENGDHKIKSLTEIRDESRYVRRRELDNDLTELSFGILAQYNSLAEKTSTVLKLQSQAIAALEARTLRGRIRRAKARVALEVERVRQLIGLDRPIKTSPPKE